MAFQYEGAHAPDEDVTFYVSFDNSAAAVTGASPTCEATTPGGAVAVDPTVTEVDATRHPGLYKVTVPAANHATPGRHLVTVKVASGATPLTQHVLYDILPYTGATIQSDVSAIRSAIGLWPRSVEGYRREIPIGSNGNSTISSTVVELAIPVGANAIKIMARAQNIRYTVDGTDPTVGGIGFKLDTAATQPTTIPIDRNKTKLKFIRDTGSNGTLNYQFIRV